MMHHRKPANLSANQLMAVELALFLLSEILPPCEPFTVLPDILNDVKEIPNLNTKQQRYLKRAKLLIGQFRDVGKWQTSIERYANLPDHLQAYAIDTEKRLFTLKRVGFGRSRIFSLKRLFD